MNNLLTQAEKFLSTFFTELEAINFSLAAHWDIDHLCFRVESDQKYHFFKKEFTKLGALLIESEVNGRLISTFELFNPIEFQNYSIHLIELPAPKKGKVTKEGFEHFEVVCDLSADELLFKYKNFSSDQTGLKKVFNKELEFHFASGNLKFHPLSLKSVIHLESNAKVFGALKQSRILENFDHLNPLVIGTFPLNIATAKSDIEIAMFAENKDEAFNTLSNYCAQFSHFSFYEFENCTVIKFILNQVPFEIYLGNCPTHRQDGYLHFLAEEKLLKYGGESIRKHVVDQKANGTYTEAAFSSYLNLEGDPYKTVLQLNKMCIRDLRNKLFFI